MWNMSPTVDYVLTQVAAGAYTAQDLGDFSSYAKGGAMLAPINTASPAVPQDLLDKVEPPRRPTSSRAPSGSTSTKAPPDGSVRGARGEPRGLTGGSTAPAASTRPPACRTPTRPRTSPPQPDSQQPAVLLRGITKRFGDLVANDAVDFDLARGEVHALLGENGAGKTTLMRILYGLTLPDSGDIVVDGRAVSIRSPRDAIAAGIGMVTQHFSLVRPMSVAENIILGRAGGMRLDLDAARATGPRRVRALRHQRRAATPSSVTCPSGSSSGSRSSRRSPGIAAS